MPAQGRDLRPSWDDYFLGIALAVSQRGDCSRRQVGAVIVRDHRIIATGYNGAPAGMVGCIAGGCPGLDGLVSCNAIHAEANAIIYGDRWLMNGADIYVTCLPCENCLKLISGAGIVRVVT